MNKTSKKSSLKLNKQTIRQLTPSLMSAVAGALKCDPCNGGPGCTHTDGSKQVGCPSEVNCPTCGCTCGC